ncbi:MAG: 50S ribosomal protein L17 [Candidatus Omnitrophota bacterium]|jgi:large subunit ribosomal protein L17|nr:MAG: 50S ribosomal protein L17 [Candidatus Omnitrophota bacterium]
MNHRKKGRKLGRTTSHREAMLANQATSLLRYGRIKTTHPKCKELKKVVERLITTAKDDSVHARRQVAKVIRDKSIVKKLFDEIVPEFSERPGGYTQIFQIGPRANDGAAMSFIQLVGYKPPEEE